MSRNLGAPLLCEDDLLAILYPGEITNIPAYMEFSTRLKMAIEQIVVNFLSHGTSIILDFPANTVNQRAWLVGLAQQANALHELRYIKLSDSACIAQLQKRVTVKPESASTDTVEMFDAISKYFEPPSAKEGLNLLIVDRVDI